MEGRTYLILFTDPHHTIMPTNQIVIRGAREHNLKNIDLALPRYKFIVFTGVSGSGKSSLAFDTLFAEGQRRYVESLSAYARQFLGQMEKPHVDYIGGLSPAIAIEQKAVSKNPRSTVGTVTEISDYLRVLFARAGTPYCPNCASRWRARPRPKSSTRSLSLHPETRLMLLAPVVRKRKGTHEEVLAERACLGVRARAGQRRGGGSGSEDHAGQDTQARYRCGGRPAGAARRASMTTAHGLPIRWRRRCARKWRGGRRYRRRQDASR
jgi:hypothetical protein